MSGTSSPDQDLPRWFGAGMSDSPESYEAGSLAAQQACEGTNAKLVILFASSSHDLRALLDGVRSVTGSTPLIGCTTAGEISPGAVSDASVIVTILGGAFDVEVASTTVGDDLFEAGSAVAECGQSIIDREHKALLMLSDGLAGDQQQVVRGAYATLGISVPLVGGCAGDDLAMVKTFQFFNDQVLEDSIVVAALASDAPLGIGARHGWRSVGEPMVVTQSQGGVVTELNGKPALEAYGERLGLAPEILQDVKAFTDFALTHPLGIQHRGLEEVRFVTGSDPAEGTITCIAEVPQGGLVWIMEGDVDSVMEGTADSTQDALDSLGGVDPIGVLAFDCIARRSVLGDEHLGRELELISHCANGAPVTGFYTYGEFARTVGSRGFHNQTLVTLAIA